MYRENFENRTAFNKEFITVSRLTALWAFSEAAFGGVLHALKIPLTGLFVGGAAVVFLTLIAHFANNKSQIIQSTIIVILVKAIVSPHTPINAYFAVFLQGVFAYILFTLIPHKKLAAFLLGTIVLSLAAFQKVIVLTLIFGNTLWESIDTFGIYLINQFNLENSFADAVQLSYLLIAAYSSIHILGGMIFGFLAGSTPNWIAKNSFRASEYNDLVLNKDDQIAAYQKKKKRKKRWWKRKSGFVFLLFSILMILIVYFNPQFDDNLILSILLMIVRSIAVTLIWFGLLSPVVIKFIKKYLAKKKSQHTKEIDEILSMFPFFKGILNYSWQKTKDLKNYKRVIPFMKNTFVLLLLAEIDTDE